MNTVHSLILCKSLRPGFPGSTYVLCTGAPPVEVPDDPSAHVSTSKGPLLFTRTTEEVSIILEQISADAAAMQQTDLAAIEEGGPEGDDMQSGPSLAAGCQATQQLQHIPDQPGSVGEAGPAVEADPAPKPEVLTTRAACALQPVTPVNTDTRRGSIERVPVRVSIITASRSEGAERHIAAPADGHQDMLMESGASDAQQQKDPPQVSAEAAQPPAAKALGGSMNALASTGILHGLNPLHEHANAVATVLLTNTAHAATSPDASRGEGDDRPGGGTLPNTRNVERPSHAVEPSMQRPSSARTVSRAGSRPTSAAKNTRLVPVVGY